MFGAADPVPLSNYNPLLQIFSDSRPPDCIWLARAGLPTAEGRAELSDETWMTAQAWPPELKEDINTIKTHRGGEG